MTSVRSDVRKGCWVWLRTIWRCAVVAMIVPLGAVNAFAQCTEKQKLTAPDAQLFGEFGVSVSVSGDTLVIGAHRQNCLAGFGCGAVYFFRFNGTSWVVEQKLTASDAELIDNFGISVSVSGNTVVVGARGDGSRSGLVYVFMFNGTSWVEEQKLTASDARTGDSFGKSVSLSGNTVVVGAPFVDCADGIHCGSAYVYRFNGTSWIEEQKLTAFGAKSGDEFGSTVSVSGDTVMVGALGDDSAAADGGSAYMFRFNGTSWVVEQKLTASDAELIDNFGNSVSVSGDTAMVGARLTACTAGADCGSVYVFRFNGTSWVEEQKLTASDAGADARFGHSVYVSGDTAVFGAILDHCTTSFFCGSAYVFRFNGTAWLEEQKLIASDAFQGDFFGGSVSLSGNTVVVGAPFHDCAGRPDCGSAYVFDLDQPCCGDGILQPGQECDGGLGCADCLCNTSFEPTVPPSVDCQPICGNGNLDPSELCDGMSDTACPGACLSDCTCGLLCGNGVCDPGEDLCNCPNDCGTPPSNEVHSLTCADGNDNDCDGLTDSADPDCAAVPTISAWGLIVLALLLLMGIKIKFGRWQSLRNL